MDISTIYILAKNEILNIHRCLESLSSLKLPIIVLDSGSTDGTLDVVEQYADASVKTFDYKNHCDSYNTITSWHNQDEAIIILDADMQISVDLVNESKEVFKNHSVEAIIAPVLMFWEGKPVSYSSLYPPKPIIFRGGKSYFEPVGHGERLLASIVTAKIGASLIHDDRKLLEQVLANQWRYAKAIVERVNEGNGSWKDKLRVKTPLFILLTPFYSFFIRRGFLDGRPGVVYALDRLIAETLAYRASLSAKLKDTKNDK